jgi:hypothetical protein
MSTSPVASPDGSRLVAAWYEAVDGGRLWHLSAGNEHSEAVYAARRGEP